MRRFWIGVSVLAAAMGSLGATGGSAEMIPANVAAFKPVTGSDPYSSTYPLANGNDDRDGNFSHGLNNNDCWRRVSWPRRSGDGGDGDDLTCCEENCSPTVIPM